MRNLLSIPLLLALSLPAGAQVINAASCSATDVQTAFSAATNSTTTINIPAGTCHWTTHTFFDVPSGNTNITVQGLTTCPGTPTPTSCTDTTLIIDDDATDPDYLLQFNTNTNTASLARLTGISIQMGSGTGKYYEVQIRGNSHNFRMDHTHLKGQTGSVTTNVFMRTNGWVYGVIDHNIQEGQIGIAVWDDNYGAVNDGSGSASWNDDTFFGSANSLFFENNTFTALPAGSPNYISDCYAGGRFVVRFNNITNAGVDVHPTGGGGSIRGCRTLEIYHNAFNSSNSTPTYTVDWNSSGSSLIWSNTAPTGYENFIDLHSMRIDSTTYTQSPPPGGWGYCGTAHGPSAWDQNSVANGYKCLDQPGTGKSDLLVNWFPYTCDQTLGQCGAVPTSPPQSGATYTGVYPNQALEPIYEWLDTYTPATGFSSPIVNNGSAPALTQNVDWYQNNVSFTGATGVGSGTLAARPSSCTTGVAYWATDQGSWNTSGGGGQGVLYKCTSTNTWTLYYTPYAFPHPLTGGGGSTVATPTAFPVAGTYSTPQRVALTTSTPAATIFYTADGSTPTVSSTKYTFPIYVAQNQTINTFATASGLTNSAVASPAYTIAAQPFVVGQSTTSSSVNPPTNPGLDRGCCGNWTWADNCSAVGTCGFSGIDNWYTQAQALGAKLAYTFLRVPQYANGSSTDRTLPPTDLASPTACPNTDASLNAGGSSSTKDCFLRSYVTLYMRHDCGLSSVPPSPVHGCHTDTFEGWNESNTDSYFSGTTAQLAQMEMDEQQIIKAYSADAKWYLGSVSAGGDGFHANGDSGIFSTSLLNLAIATQTMPNFIAPDGFSWHPYNCRTDVIPCPMPTTLVSNSAVFCTAINTPNVHCRVPVYQQATTIKSTSVAQNTSIVSWAKNLPVIGTEGGYGETNTMVAGATATASQFSIASNVVIVTATNTFTVGESIILQGWNTATYLNGATVTVLSAGLSGSQYEFNFTHANVSTTADTGSAADAAATTTIRRAYLAEWILLLAAQGTPQQLLYAGNDCPWGDYNNCGFGVVPWANGFSQTRTWLNSCPITGAFTITPVSGGNVWTRTESCGQYAFFDGWFTTSLQSTAFSTQQNLAGSTSLTGGSVTLSQQPIRLTNSSVPAPPSISVILMTP
jgi:Chitobiase/beta-hexosaminidase C-terminal domain